MVPRGLRSSLPRLTTHPVAPWSHLLTGYCLRMWAVAGRRAVLIWRPARASHAVPARTGSKSLSTEG